MKVKLLTGTQNPLDIMYVAARTCYSSKSPIELWDEWENKTKEQKWKLIKQVLDSGHQSIAEHVQLSFALEGISRSCSHQIVRHRAGIVFSQQSQRYVEIKEDYNKLIDLRDKQLKTTKEEEYLLEVCKKYFVIDSNKNDYQDYLDALINYLYRTQVEKQKAEDARNILPNATKTNIVMSCNFRQLIHMCNLRLCTRAQKPIRQLFQLIKEEVAEKYNSRLADYLVPQCEVYGFCTEAKGCGRKSQLPKFDKQQQKI